jgi:hypothetical protein
MKKQIFSALTMTLLLSYGSAKSQTKGFTKLFDGKTTKGWHSYGKTAASEKWKAENGTLHFDPSASGDGGDLVTDKEYSNFHLRIEWKVAPKSNSGIIFYVNDNPEKYGATYFTGLEMQVLDNDGHPDGTCKSGGRMEHRRGNQ